MTSLDYFQFQYKKENKFEIPENHDWIYCYEHNIDYDKNAYTFIGNKGEIFHVSFDNKTYFLVSNEQDKSYDFEYISRFNSYLDDITYIYYNDTDDIKQYLEELQNTLKQN